MNWEAVADQQLWISIAAVLVLTVIGYVALRTLLGLVTRHLQRTGAGARGRALNFAAGMLAHTSRLLILAFALLASLKVTDLPPAVELALAHGWFIALAFQAALWLDWGVHLWTESLTAEGTARNPVTTTIIGIMLRIVVWTIMLLSILANLGVDITALVAGLGVGGIAVALAVQTLLSDVFASLSIGIDKPFEIGDFVVFGDIAGTIEHIGLKTTRIRSLSGEQIVCANAELLARVLHNYKRMDTRRIAFKFGIAYDTPAEKVEEVAAMVKRVIDGVEATRFDRAHFLAFDESRLTFEVVHIVLTADYNRYMDIQQEINLGLLRGMRELGVRFAFPVRKVEFIGGSFPELVIAGQPAATSPPEPGQAR